MHPKIPPSIQTLEPRTQKIPKDFAQKSSQQNPDVLFFGIGCDGFLL